MHNYLTMLSCTDTDDVFNQVLECKIFHTAIILVATGKCTSGYIMMTYNGITLCENIEHLHFSIGSVTYVN